MHDGTGWPDESRKGSPMPYLITEVCWMCRQVFWCVLAHENVPTTAANISDTMKHKKVHGFVFKQCHTCYNLRDVEKLIYPLTQSSKQIGRDSSCLYQFRIVPHQQMFVKMIRSGRVKCMFSFIGLLHCSDYLSDWGKTSLENNDRFWSIELLGTYYNDIWIKIRNFHEYPFKM